MASELQTVQDVIQALGGTAETARLTGKRSNHVVNWRNDGRFPAATFLLLTDQLRKRGCNAPPSLWGMAEPADPAPNKEQAG